MFKTAFRGRDRPSRPDTVSSRPLRRTATCICALLVLACAVVLVPGASADTDKSVGAALNFGTQTFPAGQPFHISHGWAIAAGPDSQALGKYRFSLTVDGVQVRPDFIETIYIADPVLGTILFRPYVFNFPDGMTGTHVFAGTFLGPCQGLVDGGFATGPCSNPNEEIPTSGSPFTTTVTFGP